MSRKAFTKIRVPCSWQGEYDDSFGSYLLSDHLDHAELIKRIRVCDETKEGQVVADGGLPYRKNSFVPSGHWRSLTSQELWRDPPKFRFDTPGSFVAIINISKLTIDRLTALDDAVASRRPDALDEFVQLVRIELSGRFYNSGEPAVNGIARAEGGLETSTFDREANLRIGLHLDSWENRGVQGRRLSRNRISINFGQEPRQFLFMATPVDLLFDRFGLKPNGEEYPIHQLRAATRQQHRRIYSLQVRPGEAYVAPTECLAHDASTKGISGIDLSATIRMMLLPTILDPIEA